MNIKELHEKLLNKEFSVVEYISSIYDYIKRNDYRSFISLNEEQAIEKAKRLDQILNQGGKLSEFFAVPVAIKDNILTDGLRTTAASKSLSNFVPIFDADVVKKIKETDAIIIGKTNMDEFAMGSSSETSYFGPSKNPYKPGYTPGGSSSGSATSVAANEAIIAFGTDTGGSVRNPADFCHVVGFAPSYGAISRHGVISMSNSLDRVGIIATNVADTKRLFKLVKGKSEMDFTSHDIEEFDQELDLSNIKIASIQLKDKYGVDPVIQKSFDETVDKLKELGADIEQVALDHLEVLNQVYTVIMTVEVESNIAKVDGLRYGESVEDYDSTDEFYINNRTENFGEEVKRRIALGNFFASKDHDQKYYLQAMKLRRAVKDQVDQVLNQYDVILTPTTTLLPKKVGETSQDSNASFDSGMFNILTNLSNIPAISIPMKEDEMGSIQLAGQRNQDMKLLKIAEIIEGKLK